MQMTGFWAFFLAFFGVLTLLLLVAAASYLRRAKFSDIVTQGERGLLYRNGLFQREVGPGKYWLLPGLSLVKVSMGERIFQVSGQEIMSADRLPVRATALITYRIINPRIATEKVEGGHHNAVYFASQLALRDALAELPIEALIDARTKLDATLAARAGAAFANYGCELIHFSLRDIILPSDVKRLASDVTRARMEGAAALERARAEQATLRLLANAARLVKGNPELMNLRLLQALAPSPGRPAPTVILGATPGIVPLDRSASREPDEPSPPAND